MSKTKGDLTHFLGLIQDKKTNPLRRAYLIQKLVDEEKISKQELAYLIDKSPSYISNYLRLTKLPEVVKDALLSGIISEGHCRTLSFLDDERETIHLFEEIIRHNYSVRDTEREVNKLRTTKREYGRVASETKNMVADLSKKLGTEIKIQKRRRNLMCTFVFPIDHNGTNKLKKMIFRLQE